MRAGRVHPSVFSCAAHRAERTIAAVDIAENGDVALKKLQRASKHGKAGYDLVLTDVFMPKV